MAAVRVRPLLSWATRFQVRQYVRGSLWILPLAGGLAGWLLAQLTLWTEGSLPLPSGWTYSAGTASGLLTAIVGAMIGLLGFVVTIGVLVIQSATQTLSPRFMRLWYRDRMQKFVLATFTATLAMAFVLLRRTEKGHVPNLGVTVAGGAVLLSLVLLVLYFDRFTHRLRPVAIAALVAATGRAVLAAPPQARPYVPPDAPRPRSGAGVGAEVRHPEPFAAPEGVPTWTVRSRRSGAVQAIHQPGLVRAARAYDCVLVLVHPVGDFVPEGTVLMEAYGATAPPDEPRLCGLVAFGHERTIDQDPAFALRILVDIAIRALSPAVNDPTTAIQLVDHVEEVIGVVGASPRPGQLALADDEGRLRVLVPEHSWEQYLRLAVTEIRLYGKTSVQVCRRLRALLEDLCDKVPAAHRAAVEAELARLDATVERSFDDPAERDFARTRDRQGIGGPSYVRSSLSSSGDVRGRGRADRSVQS
ncbi:MAG: DUF2254 domain-containing protein [Actinomycetes bacterium]